MVLAELSRVASGFCQWIIYHMLQWMIYHLFPVKNWSRVAIQWFITCWQPRPFGFCQRMIQHVLLGNNMSHARKIAFPGPYQWMGCHMLPVDGKIYKFFFKAQSACMRWQRWVQSKLSLYCCLHHRIYVIQVWMCVGCRTWYRMCFLTPPTYIVLLPPPPYLCHTGVNVYRVSECLIHSATWYGMYFLTPPTYIALLPLLPHLCHTGVNVCRVFESLIHSAAWYCTCFLTHPTHIAKSLLKKELCFCMTLFQKRPREPTQC